MKPKTNTQKILDKIGGKDGEIETTKNWEAHISGQINSQAIMGKNDGDKYSALDIEREFWYGGRIHLGKLRQWIENNIEEV